MPEFITSILLVQSLLPSIMSMDTTFHYAVEVVLELEGGYVNDYDDPGGATKYGISQRSYPGLDIHNLTRAEAIQIYRRDYWEPVTEVVADSRMRILVFDSAVNHGLTRALTWFQSYPDYNDYLTNRIRFYASLNNFNKYGRGWMRRVAKIVEVSNRVQAERQRIDLLVDNRPFWQRFMHAFSGASYNIAYRFRPMTSRIGVKLDIDTDA